jgi:alpha-tubulin suppressor-like RCC1 family protein
VATQENSKIIDTCAGSSHVLILKSDGKVYSFGRNLVIPTKLINRRDNLELEAV